MKSYGEKSQTLMIRERRKNLFILSIIGFQLLNFIIFYIYVNFNSILMAFQYRDIGGDVMFTLNNFTQFFENLGKSTSELSLALRNTLIFFFYGLIMLPISFTTSYFIYKKIWFHKIFRIVFFFPSILSAIVWSNLYREIIGPSGPVAKLYALIHGLDMTPVFLADSRYALIAVILYSFWLGIAGNFVLFSGALTRIPDSVIEAGKIDGVGWLRELWQVFVPLVWPTLATMILISLTGIFTASGNILLLTNGAYGTTTISFLIFRNVYGNAETSNSYNYVAAVGMFFTMISLPIVFLSRKLLSKVEDVEY